MFLHGWREDRIIGWSPADKSFIFVARSASTGAPLHRSCFSSIVVRNGLLLGVIVFSAHGLTWEKLAHGRKTADVRGTAPGPGAERPANAPSARPALRAAVGGARGAWAVPRSGQGARRGAPCQCAFGGAGPSGGRWWAKSSTGCAHGGQGPRTKNVSKPYTWRPRLAASG